MTLHTSSSISSISSALPYYLFCMHVPAHGAFSPLLPQETPFDFGSGHLKMPFINNWFPRLGGGSRKKEEEASLHICGIPWNFFTSLLLSSP